MFWGISCDSGKRYSQNVNASYHVSMASLETRDSSYAKKSVSLMVEHKNNEFLLCTLQYEHCMQVNLDLNFQKGEDVTFFLNGQGTVHLTGYVVEDDDDSIAPPPSDDGVQIMEDFEDSSIAHSQDNHKSREHLKRSSLPTGNNEILDDSDDDDDDSDYVPTKDNSKKKNERDKPEVNGKKADMDESDDDDDDDDDDNEDDDEDEDEEDDDDEEEENQEQQEEKVSLTNQKRKVQTTGGNDPKRIKKANSTDPQASKDVAKSPKGQKPNVKDSVPTISVEDEEEDEEEEESDDEDSDEDSNEADEGEDMESSIGRTPMPPKRKDSLKKPNQVQMKLDFVPTPSASKNLTEKAQDPSVTKKKNKKKKKDNSINALEKSFGKKLDGGVEIEDLRIGKGPMAKKTRMAHISYVGQLPNKTVFDSSDVKKPFAFRLGRGEVIKGFDVGIEGMKVGGKRKIKIPPSMGYGKKPTGSIPPNSTLYFTVELKAIT